MHIILAFSMQDMSRPNSVAAYVIYEYVRSVYTSQTILLLFVTSIDFPGIDLRS